VAVRRQSSPPCTPGGGALQPWKKLHANTAHPISTAIALPSIVIDRAQSSRGAVDLGAFVFALTSWTVMLYETCRRPGALLFRHIAGLRATWKRHTSSIQVTDSHPRIQFHVLGSDVLVDRNLPYPFPRPRFERSKNDLDSRGADAPMKQVPAHGPHTG
jgi:hypothetical protein